MNFFSNLGNAIERGLGSIRTNVGKAFSATGTALNRAKSAASIMAFGDPYAKSAKAWNGDNPVNEANWVLNNVKTAATANSRPPLEIYQVDPNTGLAYGTNNSNIQTYNPSTGPGTTYYNAQGGQNTEFNQSSYGQVRPSTWSAPVDSYGRASSKSEGTPYYDANGVRVVPDRGFSGLEGMGGGGFNMANTTPATGISGLSGTGSRGFSSAGQGSAAVPYGQPTSDEEKRKQAEQAKGTVTIPGTTPNPTVNALNTMAAQGQNQPVTAPDVPSTIDMGWLSKVQETINNTNNSGMSAIDKQAVYSQLSQNLVAAKQRLDQQNPIPENPVVDTPEQLDYMNQSADPFGIKTAMDEFRASQTNLGQLQSTQVELMKNVQALNEAYRPILKDIRENPNLPKALARRKIEALAVTQKETLQGFLDQLDIVKEQISNENEKVNRQFQILNMAQNQQNQQQDNIRANLQLFLSSGAIAGFTDLELKTFAQAANMPYKALVAAKEKALDPKADIITNEFADGSLRGIDKKTGKTVWSVPGAGKAGTGQEPQLTVSDVKTLNELYGDSGMTFNYGDTKAVAQQKIARAQAMKDLQDDVRSGITDRARLQKAYPELTDQEIFRTIVQNGPSGSAATPKGGPGLDRGLFDILFKR